MEQDPWLWAVTGTGAFLTVAMIIVTWVGVQRLDDPAAQPGIELLAVEEARCAVCSAPLEKRPRRCDRCRTPHHRECWTYLGGCAIYGCESRDGT